MRSSQPVTRNILKGVELGMKMSEKNIICDIIGELLHKLDSPNNQLCYQYPSSLQLW
jgi:hypothetical protein